MSLLYDDCKELKDNGFPQEGKRILESTTDEYVKYPTLSELISECGDIFDGLEKRGETYFAFGSLKDSVGMKIKPYLGGGSTPEKAVKNLWIALHKK